LKYKNLEVEKNLPDSTSGKFTFFYFCIQFFFKNTTMIISQTEFGTIEGQPVVCYVLSNGRGFEVDITNYGGIIMDIRTPDKNGKLGSVTLGFNSPHQYAAANYLKNCPYLGAIVGRYANRIALGSFSIDGVSYRLNCNNGPNHLHGGIHGFHTKVWNSATFQSHDRVGVVLEYTSAHLEEGYPGQLTVKVSYSITSDNELVIEYHAFTDRSTHLNLTNHAYFNLNSGQGNVLDHEVQFFSQLVTVNDANGIPTGEIVDVDESSLDFTSPRKIGAQISEVDGLGYDHNYIVDGEPGDLRIAAIVNEPLTGRRLEMYTTEPGFQFYTGNFLDGSYERDGIKFVKHLGFCLEAQHYPDSPNHPEFPSTLLEPGNVYRQTTVYKFGIQ
jgi:aldose 1-epimerase